LGDGFRTVTSCADGTLRIHNVDNGGNIRTIKVPAGYVHCVAATPDGKQVFAGSDDGIVRAWNADTGQFLGAFDKTSQ
jgi:WD40 repeat protein